MKLVSEFTGELIGTFIMVLFGCSAVAVTVLFSSHVGLFQVAAVWGAAVTLAIYATRHLSCAHLNPAVSVAMLVGGRMSAGRMFIYLAAQFTGAFFSALLLYVLFSSSIVEYENLHGIVRGTGESIQTAMMFGEFYPNPSAGLSAAVSTINAFIAEAVGTCILVFMIFVLTEGCNVGRPDDSLSPLFIGLTLMIIISIIAPLTQAGLNPARDLSPRIFAFVSGWGNAALPDEHYGFITVYIIGPLTGGVAAACFFRYIIEPLMKNKKSDSNCKCT